MTFYEVDPEVERIARDPAFFTYLRDCPGEERVVLGDARLSLARDAARFGLIVADAFSSDAVPVHLLTREAIGLYLERLEPTGVLAVNVSNRYLDLDRVLGDHARDAGLTCFAGNLDAPLADGIEEANASAWVALARTREDLGEVGTRGLWRTCPIGPRSHTWTDDYSNILSVLR